jgi:hypothetical protein
MSIEELCGREWQERVSPICPSCSYELRGIPELRCPECGYRPTFAELRDGARQTHLALMELESVRANMRIGWIVLACAAAGSPLLRWVGLGGLTLFLGVFIAIGVVGFGLQALRIRQLSPQVREHMEIGRSVEQGVLLAVLGAVFGLVSLLL